MIEKVNQILSTGVEVLIAENPLLLLRVYSQLYLCGEQPRACARSQRLYYLQIQKNGLEMATKYEQAKNRTCIPNWKGSKFITATQKHWLADLITDDDAIFLLSKGYLTEKAFTKLPNGYGTQTVIEEPKDETPEAELNCIAEIKELLQSGMKAYQIKKKFADVEKIGEKKCTGKLVSELIEKAQ